MGKKTKSTTTISTPSPPPPRFSATDLIAQGDNSIITSQPEIGLACYSRAVEQIGIPKKRGGDGGSDDDNITNIPTLAYCYERIGECYSSLGDIISAKNAFEVGLERSDC